MDRGRKDPAGTGRPIPVDDLGDAWSRFVRQPAARALLAQVAIAALARLAMGRWSRRDAAWAVTVAAWWPFQEWLVHRYLLHAGSPAASAVPDSAFARYHRSHHDDPWNLDHVLIPMWVLAPAVPVHALVWFGLAPNRRSALTAVLTSGAVALAYEWTHFLTHTDHRPRRSWYRRLHRRHRSHHFRDADADFGVVAPFVDDLFRTTRGPAPSGREPAGAPS